jgi:hypothetical protein
MPGPASALGTISIPFPFPFKRGTMKVGRSLTWEMSGPGICRQCGLHLARSTRSSDDAEHIEIVYKVANDRGECYQTCDGITYD